jgi:hypothetical protein
MEQETVYTLKEPEPGSAIYEANRMLLELNGDMALSPLALNFEE